MTIVESIEDPTNSEGRSYYYRWELWRKAYSEIKVSLSRLAFGFGLEYHRYEDLSGDFILAGKKSEFKSWDNEFACLLLEVGFVGLSFYLLLYFGILLYFLRNLYALDGNKRALMACVISSIIIVLFMMTNVKMFSQQLLFLFYSMIAVGANIIKFKEKADGYRKEV